MKQKNISITILRYRIGSKTIDGYLYVNNEYLCDCAENARHAIEAGVYSMTITKHDSHRGLVPVVKGTTACLAAGNGVYNLTDATILVGEFIAPGCVKLSKEVFTKIYDRIRKHASRGKEIRFIIGEDAPCDTSTK